MEHLPYLLCITFIAFFLILPTWLWIQLTERKARREYMRAREAGRHEPVTILPLVDVTTCMGSGACVKACPEDVLSIIDGQAVAVNASACVGHGACAAVCPVDAIQLVFGSKKRGIDIPEVGPDFQTNVPGLFIAGELGGMGLISNAVEQGSQATKNAVRGLKKGVHPWDAVIVGAGPAGIASALVAKQNGLKYALLEQAVFGGAIRHYPRKKLVFMRPINFPTYGRVKLSSMRKEDLVQLLEDVVRKGDLEVREHQRVEGIEPQQDGSFAVTTQAGDHYATGRVIIAVGRRGTPRQLDVPGEVDEKVAYALLEPELYTHDHVLVVGGGDSAVETAMALGSQEGNRVWLSYRRAKINRPNEKNIKLLREAVRRGKVELVLNSSVTKISADRVMLDHAGEELVLPNDFVFVFAGGVLPTKLLKRAGIRIQRHYGRRVEPHVDEVSLAKNGPNADRPPRELANTQELPPPSQPTRPIEPAAQPEPAPRPEQAPPSTHAAVARRTDDPADILEEAAGPSTPTPLRDVDTAPTPLSTPPAPDEPATPPPAGPVDGTPGPPRHRERAARPERPPLNLPTIPRSESTQPIPLIRRASPGAEPPAPTQAVPPLVSAGEMTRLLPPPPEVTPPRSSRPLPIGAGNRRQPSEANPGRLVSNLGDDTAQPEVVPTPPPTSADPRWNAPPTRDRNRALRRVREVRQRLQLDEPEPTDSGLHTEEADAERTVLVPQSPRELAAVNTDEALLDSVDERPAAPAPGVVPRTGTLREQATQCATAGDARGAWRLYLKAARAAAEAQASREVLSIVEEALPLQATAERSLPAKEVERHRRWLHIAHSHALLTLGRWAEAVGPLRAAIEAAEADANPESLAKWRASLGRAYHRSGQFDEAVLLLDDALRSGHLADAERSATTRVLADIRLRRGDVVGSWRLWGRALDLAREMGARHAEARAHRGLANCMVVQGQLQEGTDRLLEADALLNPDGDIRVRAGVLGRLIEIDNAMGRFGDALVRGETLLDLVGRSHLDDHMAGAAAGMAETLTRIGLVDEAIDAARQAQQFAEGTDERAVSARLATARVLCNLGAWNEGHEMVAGLIDLPDSVLDDPTGQVLALRARLTAHSDPAQTAALTQQAMARPVPMLAIRAAPVRLDTAQALLDAGDPSGARDAVKRGLKLLQGTGAYGLKLELLVVMYGCAPDHRVASALVQTANKVLEALPRQPARAFSARPVLRDLLP